jgi:hypothetical protein
MNSRSKKYYEARKAGKGDKKGSATKAGYDEQNEKTIKQPKKNPAPPKNQVNSGSKEVSATQDDTGGGNDSGKRSDDN